MADRTPMTIPSLHRRRRFVPAVLLAITAALASTPALAQKKPPGPEDPYTETPPPDPYADATKAAAAKAFSAGVKLAEKGEWEEAYEKFRSAWSDLQHWQTASSLARAEVEIGRYTDAMRHLKFAQGEPNVPEAAKTEIEKLLQKAMSATGTIQVRALCRLPAVVLVDGENVGTTPYSALHRADPGEHQIEVRLEGKHKETRVDVHTAETVEVTVELVIPLPPPPPPPPAAPPPPEPANLELPVAIGLSTLTLATLITGSVLAPSRDEPSQIGGVATLVVAGGFGIASGVLWSMVLSSPPPPSAASPGKVVVSPLAGPGHAGLVLHGVF